MSEWDDLAKWIVTNKLFSEHQRWLIQVPRIFFVYRKLNLVSSFQDLLDSTSFLSAPICARILDF